MRSGQAEPLLNLLFPRRCPVCGEIVEPYGEKICPECVRALSPVREPCCKKCGKEISDRQGEYCPDCMRRPKTFDSGASLLNYNEAARWSMASIKYKNRREYLDFYAQAMNIRFAKRVRVWGVEALVPVPIHSSRRRERGFNQAEELAERLSDYWGLPVDTKLLARKNKIPKSVIIIDDIYTTGSTVEACSRILKKAGVKRIYFLAICIGKGR